MGILLLLMQCKRTTARELARKFEVSERSIYRYINSMSALGIPISTQSGPKGGIYLSATIDLNKIYFTREELNYLNQLICDEKTNPKITSLQQKINYLNKNSKKK